MMLPIVIAVVKQLTKLDDTFHSCSKQEGIINAAQGKMLNRKKNRNSKIKSIYFKR